MPELIDSGIKFVNERFNQSFSLKDILNSVGAGNLDFGSLASKFGGSILGILSTVLGSVFSLGLSEQRLFIAAAEHGLHLLRRLARH